MDWICLSCSFSNKHDLDRCHLCENPHPRLILSNQKKRYIEEEEEEDEGDSQNEEVEDEGSDDDDEDCSLRSSHGISSDFEEDNDFDTNVGKALANIGVVKIQQHIDEARKVHGNDRVVLLDHNPTYVARIGMELKFLDEVTAKAWGLDLHKLMVIEIEFHGPHYLEDIHNIPGFRIYQSSDRNLSRNTLLDASSVPIEWQLKARTNEWLNDKSNWPPKDKRFLLNVMTHLVERINTCADRCIICDSELPVHMIKPAVCDQSLCVHSHEQYGLGADVVAEIRDNPEIVDLLVNLTYAAAIGDVKRFNPFPIGVEAKSAEISEDGRRVEMLHNLAKGSANPDPIKVTKVLECLPPLSQLKTYNDNKNLKAALDPLNPLVFPLLRWVISSNRAYIAKLDESDMIPEMKTPYQYKFVSSPPERESEFQKEKKSKGSFWAFHGSDFSNWHSILRIGIKNYSNTSFMSTGAAYGAGIYMATNSSVSIGYCRAGKKAWSNSENFGGSTAICLCLCEVINAGYKANPYYVVPKENHVMTRYFFIYANNSAPSVDASTLTNLKSSPLVLK